MEYDTYLILEPYCDEAVKGLAACDKLELFSRSKRVNLRADAEKKIKERTLHPWRLHVMMIMIVFFGVGVAGRAATWNECSLPQG